MSPAVLEAAYAVACAELDANKPCVALAQVPGEAAGEALQRLYAATDAWKSALQEARAALAKL